MCFKRVSNTHQTQVFFKGTKKCVLVCFKLPLTQGLTEDIWFISTTHSHNYDNSMKCIFFNCVSNISSTISDMTLVIFLLPLYWHFTAGIRVVHRRYYLTFQMESLCITQLNTGGKGERNAIILKY